MRMQTIEHVLAAGGGAPALAAALGIHRTAVLRWKRVPAGRVLDVSRITGIAPHQLRPDLAEIFLRAVPDAPVISHHNETTDGHSRANHDIREEAP